MGSTASVIETEKAAMIPECPESLVQNSACSLVSRTCWQGWRSWWQSTRDRERSKNIDDGDDENGDNVDKDGDDAAGGVQSGMQQSPFFFAQPAQNFLPRWRSKNKESPYWNWPATTVFHNFTCKSRVSAIEVGTKSFLSQHDDIQKVALYLALSFRDAPLSKKCSFFEHCSKGLWPPPPFIWTFVLFCRGCF